MKLFEQTDPHGTTSRARAKLKRFTNATLGAPNGCTASGSTIGCTSRGKQSWPMRLQRVDRRLSAVEASCEPAVVSAGTWDLTGVTLRAW